MHSRRSDLSVYELTHAPVRMVALAIVLSVCTAQFVRAETGNDAAAMPSRDTLAPAYVDGSFGFSIRPPAVCAVIREKRPMGTADVEVVRFQNTELAWSLSVRFASTTQPLDTQTIIEGITETLRTQSEPIEVLHAEGERIAGREGVRYVGRFSADGTPWLRQQAVIRFKPTEYFALVFITPDDQRELVTDLFNRIVAGFEILRTEAAQKQLQAAIDRGRALLDEFRDGSRRLPGRDFEEHFLRFVMDDKEIGYVLMLQQAAERDQDEGIETLEAGWLFREDGTITHMRNAMFLTDDLSWEKWDNYVLTVLPREGDRPRQSLLEVERGLRAENTLLVAYSPAPNAAETRDKALEVDRTYASAAWHALLPRILDLSRNELYGFSSYTADRRGLALRTYRVVGTVPIRVDGRTVQAYRLEDSEGLIPPINEIYVDADGRLLRVVAGPLEMIRTTREHVERRYADRVREAESLISRLNVRFPVPGRRDDDQSR